MMSRGYAGAIAAAAALGIAGAAQCRAAPSQPAPSQAPSSQPRSLPGPKPPSNSPLDRRVTILNQQTVKRWTSSENQRYALPSIKLKGIGVKSKAPRGIGKVKGSLLPDVADSPTPARPGRVSDPVVRRDDSDPFPPINAMIGGRVPVYAVDPQVLTSGDNVAIARMLRPSVDYRKFSLYEQLLIGGFMPCCAWDWFNTDPTPYAFSPDGYSGGDPSLAGITDPFVRAGNSPVLQPAVAATPSASDDPEADLTGFERAGNRLYEGKPEEAIVLLRAHTAANPDDAEAARALALALIDARRTKEGVELMGRVYEQDPSLAASAIPADSVGPESELRGLVVRVVEHAHKVNTPAAWLAAAMLMQGEGRLEPALKMLERAESAGLGSDVAAAMRSALKP